jgi:hypothetical protein
VVLAIGVSKTHPYDRDQDRFTAYAYEEDEQESQAEQEVNPQDSCVHSAIKAFKKTALDTLQESQVEEDSTSSYTQSQAGDASRLSSFSQAQTQFEEAQPGSSSSAYQGSKQSKVKKQTHYAKYSGAESWKKFREQEGNKTVGESSDDGFTAEAKKYFEDVKHLEVSSGAQFTLSSMYST